jgi:GNAT superfamily N-acetyltransferase
VLDPADISLRPAAAADLDRAFAISWRCDHGAEAPVPTGDGRLGYLRHSLTTGRMVVAEAGGEVEGFAAIVTRGGVTMLADLYVEPSRHGRGIGSALLDATMGDAWPRQTFSSTHPNALPLYIRAGMAPRWVSLYLTGDPGAFGGRSAVGDGVSASDGADPAELAELERSWGGVWRPEDHAYWARGTGAIAVQIRRRSGEPFGFAYVAFSGHEEPGWWIDSMTVEPAAGPDETTDALRAVFTLIAERGTRSVGLALPGPHPATVPLLRAGWRIEDRDVYVASEPGLLDPERRIPDPTFA